MIDDPTDIKPAGYDDVPETIVDTEAVKPEDWDDEMDGEWEAPTVPNPEFKGPWKAKQIKNPAYKGTWVHPMIDNPDFVEDFNIYAYKSAFIGFDLWQVTAGTIFDNVFISDSFDEAKSFAEETFVKHKEAEKEAKDALEKVEEEKARIEMEKRQAEEKANGGGDDMDIDIAAEEDHDESEL